MSTPTPRQLADAKRLVGRILHLEGRAAMLRSLRDAARVVADRYASARAKRVSLRFHPAGFAGLLDLYGRTDATTRAAIAASYRNFLDGIDDTAFPTPRVDFDKLPPEARAFLLSPFLGLRIGGRFPQLDLQRSSFTLGTLTYAVAGGPAVLALWRAHLEKISAWLGGHWALGPCSITSITLLRRTPLPEVMLFDRSCLRRGQLYLGSDVETQRPAYLPFAEMASGTFVPGASGFGKSNALHVLLASIFANLELFAAVYLVDGKDGVTFHRYRSIDPKVRVLWEEGDLWTLTSELLDTMRSRNITQREDGADKATGDFIAVVIDEMSTFTQRPSSDAKHPESKRHAQFIDELAMLAKRGRSAGIRLIITAQEPVVGDIPASVRANCSTVVSFQLPLDTHAIAVFGQLEGLPADPRKITRGRALIKHGLTGAMHFVQFPMAPEPGRGR